ncbi:MAG: type II toxin-antitoxin system HicB family antitoxin [Desulfococcaceae bacterium]
MNKSILTGYIEYALNEATYEKLEDGTFCGRIPRVAGVIAFGDSLPECENELQSVLEEWILVGLKLGHPLPVFGGFNLNEEPVDESLAAL